MNKRQIFAISAGVLSLAMGIFAVRVYWFPSVSTTPKSPMPETHELPGTNTRLSGPYTYKNLTVYLIHGDDVRKGATPLTLEEAMERKLVVVHETSDVNELAIENVSPTVLVKGGGSTVGIGAYDVYVQAGDIVKAANRTASSPSI